MVFTRKLSFIVIGFLLVTLSSCWKGGVEKKKKGVVVINVLDKEYFDDCHIKGSIHIPFVKVKEEVPKIADKDATVVLYCSNYMCSASGEAAKLLAKLGYKKAYAYEGGVAEWHQKGYPTEGPCKKGYLKGKMSAPEKQEKYVISANDLKKKLELDKKI